ncbi:MAG TPA: AMP-binding protein [Spirochaetota bacterium]|nr:AMP-binding protein [Spirochaetota bacterium]
MNTVPEIFTATVSKYGDRVALRFKQYGTWRDVSWNEYLERATSVACGLYALGFRKGDRVAIIGDNCPEWVYVDLGTMCAGGVSVGVYATNSWDQCEFVVNHAEAKFYFMENEEQLDKWLQFRENAPTLATVFVWDLKGLRDFRDPLLMTFDELVELGKKTAEEQPDLMNALMAAVRPDDDALFIYTSGTTGRPKGAVLTHANIAWIANAIQMANPLYDTDEVLSYLPLCHVFERIFTVFAHVRYGYIVNFIENLDTITDNMREISPTVGYAVPRIWEKYLSMVIIKMSDATWLKKHIFKAALDVANRRAQLMQDGNPVPLALALLYRIAYIAVFRKLKERLGFDRMRLAYSGAAPISTGVITFFNAIGVPLLEGYGQTEGTGVTTVNRLGSSRIGTVGRPIDGVEVRIGEDDEIIVKSPGVFKGYYRDEESTRQSIIDGWLHTGDVGAIDHEGNVIITGRIKDIIITDGGKNITPQFIEGKLVFSPYVNDAIVIGDKRKYLTAIIVLDEDNVVKYAQDHKIQFSTYRDLAQNLEIEKLIQKEVDAVNEAVSRVEQIKRFTILPHKLYQEEGDVTPTMKVKRRYIQEKYADLIDGMYRG